jgi:hypothetical protein
MPPFRPGRHCKRAKVPSPSRPLSGRSKAKGRSPRLAQSYSVRKPSAEFTPASPKPLRKRAENEKTVRKTVQRSVKTTNYRTHFRRFRTVCRPISCDAPLCAVGAPSKPRNFAVAVLCSRGWPTLATWPTSRRWGGIGLSQPLCRSYPWTARRGGPVRQRAAFSSRRPFFESCTPARNIAVGHSGWWPFSRLGRRRAHVGVLRSGQAMWGDLPRTTRRGAPVRQSAAFRSRIGFLQLGDARLFAFLAAMAPRRWGKREPTRAAARHAARCARLPGTRWLQGTTPNSPRTRGGLTSHAYFLPRARVYELKVIITCRRF